MFNYSPVVGNKLLVHIITSLGQRGLVFELVSLGPVNIYYYYIFEKINAKGRTILNDSNVY